MPTDDDGSGVADEENTTGGSHVEPADEHSAGPDAPGSDSKSGDSSRQVADDTWTSTGLDLARAVAREVATRGGRKLRRRPGGRTPGTTDDGDVERSGGYSGPAPDDRDPQGVKSVVDRLVAERGWKPDLEVAGAVARWPHVVGAQLAEHAWADSFSDGVLIVRADSTSWATQVRLMSPQILARLSADIGNGVVTRIDVRGPSAPSWRHGRRSVRGRGPRDTYG